MERPSLCRNRTVTVFTEWLTQLWSKPVRQPNDPPVGGHRELPGDGHEEVPTGGHRVTPGGRQRCSDSSIRPSGIATFPDVQIGSSVRTTSGRRAVHPVAG